MSDLIVTTKHLFTVPYYSSRPGFCRSKSREWLEAHGFDWKASVRDGIPASQLEETGDALAIAVVEWARKVEQQKVGA